MNIEKNHFATKDKLHTDFLEEKYGLIVADVLRHDDVRTTVVGQDRIREVRMVDSNNILRTYAITLLTYDKNDEVISRIDNSIRSGGLIGKTFRDSGYVVKKNVIDVFIVDIPTWLQEDFQSTHKKAKARITEFYAKESGSLATPVVYGIVCEVYSPDFRNPADGINEIDRAQINPLTGHLQDSGIPTDVIWERLDYSGEEDEWKDLVEKYNFAKKSSQPIVQMLHNKFIDYMNTKK